MNKIVIIPIIATVVFANEQVTQNSSKSKRAEAVVKEGVKYIKILGKTLKDSVKSKMQEDKSGVEAAKFCSSRAEEIIGSVTRKFSRTYTVLEEYLVNIETESHKQDSYRSRSS